MSERIKKDDQTLASISFILGLTLVGLAVFVLNTMDTNSDRANAMKRAQIYAQRLIDNGFKLEVPSEPANAVRSIASTVNAQQSFEGPLGIDPWGYPFQYYVDKKEGSVKGKMVVWSSGPDNKFQTLSDEVKEKMAKEGKISFKGDDFGKVIKFKLEAQHASK